MDVLAMLKAGKFDTDPEQKARNERANKAAAKASRMGIVEVAEYLESLKDAERETFEAVAEIASDLMKIQAKNAWRLNLMTKAEADKAVAAAERIKKLTA